MIVLEMTFSETSLWRYSNKILLDLRQLAIEKGLNF